MKIIILDGNVSATDSKNNKIYSESARYNKNEELIETIGETRIITSEGYQVIGSDIIFDNKNKVITSDSSTQIKDKDGNQIFVEMFKYIVNKNMFFQKAK